MCIFEPSFGKFMNVQWAFLDFILVLTNLVKLVTQIVKSQISKKGLQLVCFWVEDDW